MVDTDDEGKVPFNIQERTFLFAIEIVRVCQKLCGTQEVMRALGRQLLKSGTSIGANMEEADGGQTKPDFIAKVAIARKEAKETVYWLRLIAATDNAGRPLTPPLLDEVKQLTSIISKIKRNAEANPNRGSSDKST